ncbi:MarR family transcriptional regulator, partial [Sinorhizobium meliloti]
EKTDDIRKRKEEAEAAEIAVAR